MIWFSLSPYPSNHAEEALDTSPYTPDYSDFFNTANSVSF